MIFIHLPLVFSSIANCAIFQWDLRANHIEQHFMDGERISAWKIPFPRPRDVNRQWPGNDEGYNDERNDYKDFYGSLDDFNNSNYMKDFRQPHGGVERSNNQITSSTVMSWNCRTQVQEPPQELDDRASYHDWDSENENDEDESTTYTQTIVGEPADSFIKHSENPSGPEKSINVAIHGIFSTLEEYLSTQQQHEHLVIGLGRRPLNVFIDVRKYSRRLDGFT